MKVHQAIQKYFDGEMQGFVGGIGHNKTKKNVCTDSLPEVQTSYAWRSDSTITFQNFANRIKVSYRNAASKIYSEFIYTEGYEVCVSVYFVKLELLLVLLC